MTCSHLPKSSRRVRVVGIIGLSMMLLTAIALGYVYILVPPVVWLPKAVAYTKDDDTSLFALPNQRYATLTRYGKAAVFTTPQGVRYYEFVMSPLLNPSRCPDIAGLDTLDPSGCIRQGSFHGADVYGIYRDNDSSQSEWYILLGQTFLYIVSGTGYDMSEVNTLTPLQNRNLEGYLRQTTAMTRAASLRQAQARNLAHEQATSAYTKLPFTPALPSTLPSGWHMLTDTATPPVTLDGPDVLHPVLLNVDYTNGHGLYIRLHVGALSTFHTGATCGPTPGYSMQNLPCTRTGAGYWEAVEHTATIYVRYLYYPVGNSLVISEVTAYAYGNQAPALAPSLLTAQEQLTLSAKLVTAAVLKGSMYKRVYF